MTGIIFDGVDLSKIKYEEPKPRLPKSLFGLPQNLILLNEKDYCRIGTEEDGFTELAKITRFPADNGTARSQDDWTNWFGAQSLHLPATDELSEILRLMHYLRQDYPAAFDEWNSTFKETLKEGILTSTKVEYKEYIHRVHHPHLVYSETFIKNKNFKTLMTHPPRREKSPLDAFFTTPFDEEMLQIYESYGKPPKFFIEPYFQEKGPALFYCDTKKNQFMLYITATSSIHAPTFGVHFSEEYWKL